MPNRAPLESVEVLIETSRSPKVTDSLAIAGILPPVLTTKIVPKTRKDGKVPPHLGLSP